MQQPPGEAQSSQVGPPQQPFVPPPPSKGRFAGFEALGVTAYRWYALCATLQTAAESMQMLANGWFAFELTGSTAVLGLTALAQALPQTLLSFMGGVISDRFPRQRVWQVMNVFAAMISTWIFVSIALGIITWHDLVIRSFLFGIILAFRAPARQGIMTEVVGREKIMSAVSMNQTIMNIFQFVGPAVAGFLIGGVGIKYTYLIMTCFYILSIFSLLPMRYQRRNISLGKGRGSFIGNFKDGLKYVGRTPDVRAVLGLTLLAGAFAMPYNQLLPAFGKTVLHIGPAKLGLLSSLTGIGALTGSMSVTFLRPKSRGLLLIRTVGLVGVGLVAFCLSSNYYISLGIVMLIGVGQAIRQNMQSTLIQTYTEDGYLGRVISLNQTQMGVSSLSSFAVAIGAGQIGVRNAVLVTSFLLIGVGAAYWTFSRRLRKLS